MSKYNLYKKNEGKLYQSSGPARLTACAAFKDLKVQTTLITGSSGELLVTVGGY